MNNLNFVSKLFSFQSSINSKTNKEFITLYFESGEKRYINPISLIYVVLKSLGKPLTGKTMDTINDDDLKEVETFLSSMIGKNVFVEMNEDPETGYENVSKFVLQQGLQSNLLSNAVKTAQNNMSENIAKINSLSTKEDLTNFILSNPKLLLNKQLSTIIEGKQKELKA